MIGHDIQLKSKQHPSSDYLYAKSFSIDNLSWQYVQTNTQDPSMPWLSKSFLNIRLKHVSPAGTEGHFCRRNICWSTLLCAPRVHRHNRSSYMIGRIVSRTCLFSFMHIHFYNQSGASIPCEQMYVLAVFCPSTQYTIALLDPRLLSGCRVISMRIFLRHWLGCSYSSWAPKAGLSALRRT